MSNIDNLHGAISFTNMIKNAIEGEIAFSETAKMQVSNAVIRLGVVADYLEDLSQLCKQHGIDSKREDAAMMTTRQVALSVASVEKKIDDVQKELKSFVPMFESIIAQMQGISETP